MTLAQIGITSSLTFLADQADNQDRAMHLRCDQCHLGRWFGIDASLRQIWLSIVEHRTECRLQLCAWCDKKRGDEAIGEGIGVKHTLCADCAVKVREEIAAMHGSTAMGPAEMEVR